jgi:tetratricopeptide (TPR) repeat protein
MTLLTDAMPSRSRFTADPPHGRTAVATRLVHHYVRSVRRAALTFGQRPLAPIDETLPGIVPETFASGRDATRWYREERDVLYQVARIAVALGDHRSALTMLLDWRPMRWAVESIVDQRPMVELTLAVVPHVDEPVLEAEAYRDVASHLDSTGRPDDAVPYFDRAAGLFEQIGDHAGLANVLRNVAMSERLTHDERIDGMRRAVAVAREIDDEPFVLASALHALAAALNFAGRFDDALVTLAECLAITSTTPGLENIHGNVTAERAQALAGTGRLAESADEWARALELERREGHTILEVELLLSYGDVLTALGRLREAEAAWRRFLELATPELVAHAVTFGQVDGARIIADVRKKLAELGTDG